MTLTEFTTMAQRLRPAIVARARGITHDDALADDVAQDTLLRLWQMHDRLDEYDSVEALTRVIGRNLALDAMRKRGATVSIEELAGELPERYGAEADSELIAAEEEREADAVMAALPATQRHVMDMRHRQGMEIDEIARVAGTTPANIRVILCRARAKVREIYNNRQ